MRAPYRLPDDGRGRDAERLATSEPRPPLGRLRSRHVSGAASRRILAAATAIAGILAILTLAWPHATALVLASFLLALAVAFWVLAANVLGLDVVVDVRDAGLVVRRAWRRPVIARFDDVRELRIRGAIRPEVSLALRDGRRVVLPAAVSDAGRLVASIETAVERPVLDEALRALASGEPLVFDGMTLELDGIRDPAGRFLPWWDLDRVTVADDAFVLRARATDDAFAVLDPRRVPFPRILVALLARRAQVACVGSFWTRWVR